MRAVKGCHADVLQNIALHLTVHRSVAYKYAYYMDSRRQLHTKDTSRYYAEVSP